MPGRSNNGGRTELVAAAAAQREDSGSIVSGSGAGVNGAVVVPLPLLVDRRQAAKLLNVSVGKLDELIRRGELRPVRIGRRVTVAIDELRAFVALRTGGAA